VPLPAAPSRSDRLRASKHLPGVRNHCWTTGQPAIEVLADLRVRPCFPEEDALEDGLRKLKGIDSEGGPTGHLVTHKRLRPASELGIPRPDWSVGANPRRSAVAPDSSRRCLGCAMLGREGGPLRAPRCYLLAPANHGSSPA